MSILDWRFVFPHLLLVGAKTGTTSKYRGVTLFRSQNKYQAFVKTGGVRLHCGMWRQEADAALARDRAVLFFELDTPLNFPARSRRVGPQAPESLVREARSQQRRRETSDYHGVHFDRRRSRWAAILCVLKKPTPIAQFDDPRDAAEAYDRAALYYLGEEATLNFPDSVSRPAPLSELRKWARSLFKRKTSSRYRGVTLDRRTGGFFAQAQHQGKHYRKGPFDAEGDAALAYDALAKKLWHRKAVLNFG